MMIRMQCPKYQFENRDEHQPSADVSAQLKINLIKKGVIS
jgi:hypothetical protein